MEVKMKRPYVSRNLVKYEGLEVKNERRRLNIKFTRNLGMKVKSILYSKRPYQILSLCRKDEIIKIGLVIKGRHLA